MDKVFITKEYGEFLNEIKKIIADSRFTAVRTINKELILLCKNSHCLYSKLKNDNAILANRQENKSKHFTI